jgi:hypothetical protein
MYILAETWNQANNKVVFMHKQLTNKHFSFYEDDGNYIQLWMNCNFETGIINISECPRIVQTNLFIILAIWADHFWLSSNLILKLPWN